MAVVALQSPYFLKILHQKDREKIHGFGKISAANLSSSETRREQESTIEISKASLLPHCEQIAFNASSTVQFDRLQPEEEGLEPERIQVFGQFVAREAFLDEEFWTAAWLRAESQWEDKRNDRYVDSYKRKFAEQEFNALKRISRAKFGYNKQTCIVAVKKESGDVKRTVVKSVAGTLDLSLQYLSQGEAFPGMRMKTPLYCSKDRKSSLRYGYIANLCVAKSARRLGIASNMLHLAIRRAKAEGADQVLVHVYRHNTPAKELYHKLGFKEVDLTGFNNPEEQILLLRHQIMESE